MKNKTIEVGLRNIICYVFLIIFLIDISLLFQILVKGSPNIKKSIWSYNGGHFVAIHGYQDGKTFIYDSSREDILEKAYDLEEVWMNIRNPLSDGCGSKNHMTAIW